MPSGHVRTAATAALGAAIVGPAVTHVIFSDFERYRAPEATTATFVAGEGHESLCWLPRGRGAAPSKNHCYEFPPVEGGSRRREIQTYSGHCFGFLNGSDVVTGSACVARGRTEHGPDSSSVLDRLLELRASAAAALARQRRRIYRALQLLLLADVAFFGTGSTGRRRKGPPAPVWTTHHLFLSVGVGTMLLDHAAKGLLNHGGSLLTMPAQVGGGAPSPFPHHSLTHHPRPPPPTRLPWRSACWFYYLGGANTRPDGRGAAVALIAVHAVLLELMPLPGARSTRALTILVAPDAAEGRQHAHISPRGGAHRTTRWKRSSGLMIIMPHRLMFIQARFTRTLSSPSPSRGFASARSSHRRPPTGRLRSGAPCCAPTRRAGRRCCTLPSPPSSSHPRRRSAMVGSSWPTALAA